MNSAPIRIGVVGLGAVAQSVHLPLIRRRSDLFSLAGVSDISQSLVASVGGSFGVPPSERFSSAGDLLALPELDAVLVASGGSHVEIVVMALQRGIPVLCEKPLAFTLAEGAAIEAAIPAGGKPLLMVGYMKQYDPAVARAAELLSEIDDVRTVDIAVLHPTGQSQLDFAHLRSGSGDVPSEVIAGLRKTEVELRAAALGDVDEDLWRLYSGCLLSSVSHDFSILRRLFGPPHSVDHVDVWRRRSQRQRRETGRDVLALGSMPPSIRIAGALEDSSRFLIDWHYLNDYPSYRESVRIVHGSGSLELAFPSPYLLHTPTVLTTYTEAGDAEAKTEFRSIAEAFELQLEAFADMVRSGTPPMTGLEGAIADVKTSQAVMAAYAEGAHLSLGGEVGSVATVAGHRAG